MPKKHKINVMDFITEKEFEEPELTISDIIEFKPSVSKVREFFKEKAEQINNSKVLDILR